MTEAEFQTYVLAKLWRSQDTALADALPDLISETNDRINRDVLPVADTKVAVATKVDGYYSVPDLNRIKTVYHPTRKCILKYVNPALVKGDNPKPDGYTIEDGKILIGEADGLETSDTINVTYYNHIEPFFDDDGMEPFTERHLDFYTTAVMQHVCATWLMDFEWADQLEARYQGMLENVRSYENYRAYGAGGSLQMVLPGIVA